MSDSTTTISILALAHGGEVIGAPVAGEPDARKVFVRGAIPGEEALVEITEAHKNFRRGILKEVRRASVDRVVPPCSYFGVCGGCDYQYISISAQRALKRDMVESMLKRQAGIVPHAGVKLCGEELPAFEYRRRITVHVGRSSSQSGPALGFFKEGTGDVVDLSVCLLATPKINCALQQVRVLLPDIQEAVAALVIEEYEEEIFVAAKLREDALERVDHEDSAALKVLSDEFDHFSVLDGEKPLFSQFRRRPENLPDRVFPTGRFSQINEDGNALLIGKVLELITQKEVTDLYAGAGNFSFPLVERGCLVEAVELDPELVAHGDRLRQGKGISPQQLAFAQSSCEQFVKKHRLRRAVLLDPPRSGADGVVKALDPSVTKEVVYVSCGLPTFCRDAKTLFARGYKLEQTWVVDMFAQTHHVETVSRFTM